MFRQMISLKNDIPRLIFECDCLDLDHCTIVCFSCCTLKETALLSRVCNIFLLCCEAEVSGLPLLVVAKIRNVLQEVGHELNLLIMIR